MTPSGRWLWHSRACLLLFLLLRSCSAQPNPIDVGIDSSVVHKWWFWLIIGVIACFFIVATFFVWRGFRNYRRYKKESEELEKQQAQRVTVTPGPEPAGSPPAKDLELGLDSSAKEASPQAFAVDDVEMARRTGQRKVLSASHTSKF